MYRLTNDSIILGVFFFFIYLRCQCRLWCSPYVRAAYFVPSSHVNEKFLLVRVE
jgi:hypothetical protein